MTQTLNVFIALAGIYVALAVACSWLQEQFAAIAKLRATTLEKGIRELVARDATVFASLKSHPLILAASSEATQQFPSYVDARNFSLAFWQSVATSSTAKAVSNSAVLFGDVAAEVNAWTPATDEGKRLKQSVLALIDSAKGEYGSLLTATETWFNAQMDRVSGWYKRTAQYLLLAFAVVVSFGLGIDTIDLSAQLSASPTIAQGLSEAIRSAATAEPKAGTSREQAVATAVVDAKATAELRLANVWWSPALRDRLYPRPATGPGPTYPGLPAALLGMLVTAIAVSLGAPFWFDLLKLIVNVRMAGDKPAAEPPPRSR